MTNIYIIASEFSGDYIGAKLIKGIREVTGQHDLPTNNLTFIGIGGPLMVKAGLKSIVDINAINMMGFIEVLPHVFKLQKLINRTVQDIIITKPAILITIDAPGFTYRVAAKVRAINPNLPMIHVVAPSVWAYKPSRALKYAKIYNHLLALLPFEPQYFTKLGLPCTYIGHPILEQPFHCDKMALRAEFGIAQNVKILCVTLGSRKGEIIKHLPIFKATLEILATEYQDIKIIFVINNHEQQRLITPHFVNSKLDISCSQERLKIYALADVGLAKSGTNTIEIAASRTPVVVAYKLNTFTFMILKLLIKIKFANLINIIAGREIIPEFIQSNCLPWRLAIALRELLDDKVKRYQQVTKSMQVLQTLGLGSPVKPSITAASIISKFLK